MKHIVSRELHSYWNRLRGARAAPERSDLDPAAIRMILADTFLVDVKGAQAFASRTFDIRLAGTRLNALFGEDLKGRSLLSLWRRADSDAMHELMDLALDEQVPVVAGAHDDGRDKALIEIELLLLPLRHHGKTHARLLGSLVPTQPLNWLGLKPAGDLTLTSFRRIDSSASGGFRNRPMTFSRGISAPTKHGRFMVYEGGR